MTAQFVQSWFGVPDDERERGLDRTITAPPGGTPGAVPMPAKRAPPTGLDQTVAESTASRDETDTRLDHHTRPGAGAPPSHHERTVGQELRSASIERFGRVSRGRFEILGELARGGLGRVMSARDPRTGRTVALKEVLQPSPDIIARFAREAMVTANLQHPSIVPVYEVGRWESGEPFYAMKLVQGRTLDALIAEATAPAARLQLLPHVIAVADALAYAHGEHVIHRDLKPANVLVGSYGETVVEQPLDLAACAGLAR